MEETIELDIPILLPGIENDQDGCLRRLEQALQNQKGILRAHLQREKTPVDVCLHFDPNSLSLEQVRRMAERAGAQIVNRYHHASIPVEGMDCSDCVTVLEHGVRRVEGVLSVSANYASERMWVEYDSHRTGRAAIEKRVRSLGYAVPRSELQRKMMENRALLFSLLAGVCVAVGWLGGRFFGFPTLLSTGLYLGTYLLGGWDVSRHAWSALRERRFDTDFLMVVAALGAAALGDFAEGGLLLFLFSLGTALEDRALDRARRAVEALGQLAPRSAFVRRDGREKQVPVERLQLGDMVIVRANERIPVDGLVTAGWSGVDQSPVTGESLPVDKAPGEMVFAGTVNGEGALEVSVRRLAKDSTLSRIMKMVEEAQAQKSPTQQTMEKFARVFVPASLGVTLLAMAVPPLFGVPFRESFLRAMTLLVAASPCALALGAPAAVLAGAAQAARNGVLVKGGAHLENLGRIKAIAFDKTGTLTHGRAEVSEVVTFGKDEAQVLSLLAGAESRSAHPLAQAIVKHAQSQGATPSAMEKVESLAGHGLRAVKGGKTIWIGSQNLMEEKGVRLTKDMLVKAESLQAQGKSLVWIAEGRSLLGLAALSDKLRENVRVTLNSLHRLNVEQVIMLTGDNPKAAASIAKQAGVSGYRAGLMPEDKLGAVKELVKEFGAVAMVGDGVNDAPALAHATVGIAMGGAGSEAALESADVALMGDDLSRLPFALGLGRATRRVILQNLVIALGAIGVLMVTSLAGLVGMGVAVVVHEGSTLLVVVNALRLLGYKNKAGR